MQDLTPHMREATADYLMNTLPPRGREGWEDMAMTAWQFGCEALVALGYAQEKKWGASRITPAEPPTDMPRWDDIAWVVINVMDQRRDISFRTADGSCYEPTRKPGQFVVTPIYAEGQEPVLPPPNIAAAHGLGPARVDADLLPLLEALGLVQDDQWTEAAEFVFWRDQPRAWEMAVTDDPRFEAGIKRCLQTMPTAIVATLQDLVIITPDDIAAAVERQEAANADLVKRFPAQGKFDRTVSPDGQFRTLISVAQDKMDWHFFRGWRFVDGWLSDRERERALPLFHDRLAQQMRDTTLSAMGLEFPTEMPQ